MNKYQSRVMEPVIARYGELPAGEMLEALLRSGVIDFGRCKVAAVREFVEAEVRRGEMKMEAMFEAAERFACSYDYVRKCIYYYKNVAFDRPRPAADQARERSRENR